MLQEVRGKKLLHLGQVYIILGLYYCCCLLLSTSFSAFCFVFGFTFLTGSLCAALAGGMDLPGLEFMKIHLPLPPKSWNWKGRPPHLEVPVLIFLAANQMLTKEPELCTSYHASGKCWPPWASVIFPGDLEVGSDVHQVSCLTYPTS